MRDQTALHTFLHALTLQGGYNTTAVVLSATLLGLAAGVVGCLSLLRRRAMMSDVLAHCTLPGIALAFLASVALGAAGRSVPVLMLGAAITGILGVLAVQLLTKKTRLREDTAMAAVLGTFFGVGIVLLSVIQNMRSGTQGGLTHFIYGQTAAMRTDTAVVMAAAATLAAITVALLYKEFKVLCFDDRFAAALGLPLNRLDLILMSLVIIVTVVGLNAVGLILIVALLIIPAATARLWSDRFATVICLSALAGALSGWLGSALSASQPRLPTGAVIVLTASAIFFLSLTFAPNKGLLAAARKRLNTTHPPSPSPPEPLA